MAGVALPKDFPHIQTTRKATNSIAAMQIEFGRGSTDEELSPWVVWSFPAAQHAWACMFQSLGRTTHGGSEQVGHSRNKGAPASRGFAAA